MKKRISDRRSLFCAILFLGFVSCIYAPFELYTLNTEDLWFSLKDFWYIPLVCGAFAMITAALLGLLLSGTLLKIYTGIIFGTAICIYAQGHFLNLKLGEVTGDSIDWSQYKGRMILNLLLWVFIICVITAFCIWGKKYVSKIITGVSLFMTAMLFVTLIVLIVPCLTENKKQPEQGYPTNKDLTSLSDDTNVLVFVLDRYDVNFFKEALKEVPEFEEQLDGFIWFDNFAGCYISTIWAIPFMLSGNYCLQGNAYAQVNTACADKVYWDELIDSGYEMSIYTQSELIPPRAAENSVNFVKADFVISDHKAFTVLLYKLVMCKYFPDIVKPLTWLLPYDFEARRRLESVHRVYTAENLMLVDYLDDQAMSANAEHPQFKFIHVSGAHPPYTIDEWGQRPKDGNIEEGAIKGSLRLVLRYIEEMKALDIYDDSVIIITADHGDSTDDYCTSPVFLVKPRDSHGPLTVNHTPSSQSDLGATILDLAGVDTDLSPYGVSVFDEAGERKKKRYYYISDSTAPNIVGKSQYILTEYEVDPEGISLENFHLTGVEYGPNDEKTVE